MTNIYGNPEKKERRKRLWEIGIQALEGQGWRVDRVSGSGKSSMRRLRKHGLVKVASIRTTQDCWYAFPRTGDDKGWLTLDDVDTVVIISVDDKAAPKLARVHIFDQREVKARLDRAYAVRAKAGRSFSVGRGHWVSLYESDDGSPTFAGAGIGNDFPPVAEVALAQDANDPGTPASGKPLDRERVQPLTMGEAKQDLALTFGVDPSQIKTTIEA